MVVITADTYAHRFRILRNIRLRVLMQLRHIPPQALQLCYKEKTAVKRRYFHPHSGVNLQFLLRVRLCRDRRLLLMLFEKIQ